MDFRKTESQTLKLKIKRKNIIPLLYDIFDSFKEIAILKNIKISFLHDLEEIILYFDEEQLEKVFFNLLTNAIKFTPRGGSICLQVKIKDNKVTITVSDNGKGIAPEYINNLFTNFFQVADHGIQNTGYGIGLALSKNIIECDVYIHELSDKEGKYKEPKIEKKAEKIVKNEEKGAQKEP
jgi:signal transduction histidine kinase